MSAQNRNEVEKMADFVANINKFNYLYPQEKVYLHFDNTGYFLGETIWFKAYITVAEDNRLSELSKVLYVELLTPEGKIVETQKLKIDSGQARGGVLLKNRYFPGYYQVRAYTRCMLNFGENVIFSRVFPVYAQAGQAGNGIYKGDVFKEINIKPYNMRKQVKSNDLNLAFFPEGGNLITGITSTVAFKATDKEGKDINVTGRIYNSSDELITTFSSLYQGMGSFVLQPDGNKLIAKINCDGKDYKFNLPESKQEGYVMRIDNLHPETLTMLVEKTPNLPAQTLGITFTCREKVYVFQTFEMDSTNQYTFRLSKKDLPQGVFQITLFTPQGEVMAQRQAFVNNNIQFLPVKATQIHSSFKPFSPIAIDFEIKDENNKPVETIFSLSIRDDSTIIKTNYTDNILYNQLLSSDLKGYIENPAYYFETDDNQHRMALDLLMLVQGWTRYSWKQSTGVEPFHVKQWIEKGLMIEGSVLSYQKMSPQEDIEVTLWTSQQGSSQKGKCITDKEGKFNLEFADFTGTCGLSLSADRKDKNGKYSLIDSRFTIDRNFSPPPLPLDYYETHPVDSVKNEKIKVSTPEKLAEVKVQTDTLGFQELSIDKSQEKGIKSIILPELVVIEKKPARQALLDNPNLIVHDVKREIDNFLDKGEIESRNVFEYLENVDPYFTYSYMDPQSYKHREFAVYDGTPGMAIYSFYDKKPVFFCIHSLSPLNQGSQPLNVADLHMDEIEYIAIESYKSIGNIVHIDIILNESGRARYLPKGLRNTYFEGFAQPVEFYSPDYSSATLPEPDVRRTLYWNPDVKTDSLGQVSVHFYNNATCKKISISAEGLTNGSVPVIYKGNEN